MADFLSRTLLWIVLLPLFGAIINGLAGKRASKGLVTAVAVGSVFGSFLLALFGFGFLLSAGGEGPQSLTNDVYQWFSIDVRGVTVPVHVRFVMDHLSGIMTVMVTGIAALIHVYSVGYMEEDEGYARFMTYLNLFTASMLILVLASNLPLMFVGWEGVGLCSYLLIGYWFENEDYAKAGKKAFIVNRIGDFGVLIGMFILMSAVADPRTTEAFEFAQINAVSTRLGLTAVTVGTVALPATVATVAALFIFLGCAGKSAQLPLYVWLPDAMAGPTPVSALIHAATMVTAGVYLCCRLSPVIVESPFAMCVIAIVGALTALMAASIALVQNEMKKILAYSTVSQLGFMFAAVGMGAFAGGFFHVFTHAFFKACLFLGAGSVMHAIHAHGDADIRYLGGLRHKMPKTHITFALATAAIAGLPLLSGFFSKDEILLGAATWGAVSPYAPWVGWTVFGILVVAATMTAFYMFRLYFRTFWGEYKGGHAPHGHDEEGETEGEELAEGEQHAHWVEPHESPGSMTTPLYVLAAGAVLVGFLGLPHLISSDAFHVPNWWSGWLTPSHEVFLHAAHEAADAGVAHEEVARTATRAARQVPSAVASLQFEGQMVHADKWVGGLAMGLGSLAGLLGFFLAFFWYHKQNGEVPARIAASVPRLHRFLMDKWRVDELYGVIIVAPMKWLGVFAANLDRFAVDGLLTHVTSGLMRGWGYVLTRAQNGMVHAYAGLFVVGMGVLFFWFTYPHPQLEGEASVGQIEWSAGQGLSYEYRWDFDSDGQWDTGWGTESTASHAYEGSAYYGLVAILVAPGDLFGPQEIGVEQSGEAVEVPVGNLGPGWAAPPPAEDAETEGPDLTNVAPTMAYEDGAMVLNINGANITDRDGEDDGRITLRPGETIAFGGARLTVAVRIRGTVEVRNAFGNLMRGTEDVTLRVQRASEGHARAEVLR